MTSANKKPAYYDFKHSYQYPMNHGTMEDFTKKDDLSGKETKNVPQEAMGREKKNVPEKGLYKKVGKRKVVWVPQTVEAIKRKKILFPSQKNPTDPDASN